MSPVNESDNSDLLLALNKLVPTTNDGKKLVPALITVFESFQYKFVEMVDTLKTDIINVTKEQDLKITSLQKEVFKLNKKVSDLEDKIDDQEAYERREQLLISGPAVPAYNKNEDPKKLVSDIIKSKLNIELCNADISCAHRNGAIARSQKSDRRPIIVKFTRRDLKSDILSSCRRVKPTDIFVNESLTSTRQKIAYALRKAKKDFSIISGTTTIEGMVYVWVKPTNPAAAGARDTRFAISNLEKLRTFFMNTLGTSVDDFLAPVPLSRS